MDSAAVHRACFSPSDPGGKIAAAK